MTATLQPLSSSSIRSSSDAGKRLNGAKASSGYLRTRCGTAQGVQLPMSFDVNGIGSIRPADVQRQPDAGFGARAAAETRSYADAAVQVDLESLPESPPPEVADAMTVASDAYEQLSATGQQIHFGFDQANGGFAVELRDLNGTPLSTLSGSEALQIAGGESLN
jgi:hypothetical protein